MLPICCIIEAFVAKLPKIMVVILELQPSLPKPRMLTFAVVNNPHCHPKQYRTGARDTQECIVRHEGKKIFENIEWKLQNPHFYGVCELALVVGLDGVVLS